MKIENRRFKEENVFSFDELAEDLSWKLDEGEFCGRVKVNLSLSQGGERYLFSGKVIAKVKMECSRCLNQYEEPIEASFDFVLKKQGEGFVPEAEEDLLNFVSEKSDFLVIDQWVKEAIILGLPLKPLCQEDCKGICPSCGADLNITSCNCAKKEVDPRWEKLKKFLNNK